VHVATALPLKGLSRFFGWFNELTLPMWLRRPGLTLYATIFGCNLEEMADPDLTHYDNLAEFFYRELKKDARPIDDALIVSPSDGRVLHFGAVVGRQVEQVKGVTYDLDAFLGTQMAQMPRKLQQVLSDTHASNVASHREFANINGIQYTLDELLSGAERVSTESTNGEPEVKALGSGEMADRVAGDGTIMPQSEAASAHEHVLSHMQPGNRLYYCVIYLAPGDYHRFHSPTNWVVHGRRHVAGELYSVSPYMAGILKDLFVLNERVVLLGRWKHGFFSMSPVGATNVGSIRINFDQPLETNKAERRLPHGTYTEASYASFSPLLGGRPTRAGEEIGGFRLGSTVVLVFEAPKSFEFALERNQRIKLGQSLGHLKEEPMEP
ncbi:phosphatidylserine decarboxylase-domain-containing protein, partial [Thamnocephalis sphaerospora]